MSEWWTYRLSDFLMFSARTYRRLFELYNAETWPLHVPAICGGALLVAFVLRGGGASARAALALLAAAWLWIAWAFHWQRYATINWAASGFAAAFALEALLMVCAALSGVAWRARDRRKRRRAVGLALLLTALVVQPLLGLLFARPWGQAEVLGMAPDPTAVSTLGVLLLLTRAGGASDPGCAWTLWLLWPIPIAWCLLSGATLWTIEAPEALLLPALVVVAWIGARADRIGDPAT